MFFLIFENIFCIHGLLNFEFYYNNYGTFLPVYIRGLSCSSYIDKLFESTIKISIFYCDCDRRDHEQETIHEWQICMERESNYYKKWNVSPYRSSIVLLCMITISDFPHCRVVITCKCELYIVQCTIVNSYFSLSNKRTDTFIN